MSLGLILPVKVFHTCVITATSVPRNLYDQGGESKSHPLRGEGENMPFNNGENNI